MTLCSFNHVLKGPLFNTVTWKTALQYINLRRPNLIHRNPIFLLHDGGQRGALLIYWETYQVLFSWRWRFDAGRIWPSDKNLCSPPPLQIGALREQLSILCGLQHLYHFNSVQATSLIVLTDSVAEGGGWRVGLSTQPGRCSCGLAFQDGSQQSMLAKGRQQLKLSVTSPITTLQSSRCGYNRPGKTQIVFTHDSARRQSDQEKL